MKHLYSRLTLIISIGLVMGSFLASGAWTSMGTVSTGDQMSANLWNTLVGNVDDLNSRIGSTTSSQWSTSGATISYTGGNVGIGTSTPSQSFEVNGVGVFRRDANFVGSTNILVQNFDTSASTLHNAGLVWSLAQTGNPTGFSAAKIFAGKEQEWTTTTSTNNSYLSFQTTLSGSIGEKFRITSNGNVGIGTASPAGTLDIIRPSTTGFPVVLNIGDMGNTVNGALRFTRWAQTKASIEAVNDSTYARKSLVFYTNSVGDYTSNTPTERMRITSSGDVGIGTTDPTMRLSLRSGGLGQTGLSIFDDVGTKEWRIREISNGSSRNGNLSIQNFTDNNNVLEIDSAGNVGIGTTAPASRLDVKVMTATGNYAYFGASTDGGARGIQMSSSDNGIYLGAVHKIDATSAGGIIDLATGGSTRLRITETGKVGIGTNNPQEKLHIFDGAALIYSINAADRFVWKRTDGSMRAGLSWDGARKLHILADGAERVTVDGNGGNVGIGTTSPGTKLEIKGVQPEVLTTGGFWPKGTLQITDNGSYTGGTSPTITFYKERDASHNQTIVGAISGGGTFPDHQLQFWGKSNSANNLGTEPSMVIRNNGWVGIGTTTPNKLLHLKTPTGTNAELDIQSGTKPHWGVYQDETSEQLRFWNEADRVTFSSGGNVGIGITTPVTSLHVLQREVGIAPSLTADNGVVTFSTYTTPQLQIGGYPTSPYAMWMQVKRVLNDGNTYPLSIQPLGGNVGIGTTSPSYKLDVSGTIRAVGNGTDGVVRIERVGNATAAYTLQTVSNELRFIDISSGSEVRRMVINSTGNVLMNSLAGTYTNGAAFVCVNNSGQLYASEVACP